MTILDTTVLVYAVGDDHVLAAPAREWVERIRSGEAQAHTTVEVIQEFAHVRARRRGREDAARLAGAYAALLAPLAAVNTQHLAFGLDLWRKHPSLGTFDAVLAAVAMSLDTDLVSADQAFADIDGLRWQPLA